MVRQQIKLAAVLAVVVLALTGFSTSSHGHGGSSHSSGGDGGGCSNSHKTNGDYNSNNNRYDDDDDDDDSGSGSGSSTDDPTADPTETATVTEDPAARVVTCAKPAEGSHKAVTSSEVELTPASFGTSTVKITVTFSDSAGNTIDTADRQVQLDATDSLDPQKFTVPMSSPDKVEEAYRCTAEAVAVP